MRLLDIISEPLIETTIINKNEIQGYFSSSINHPVFKTWLESQILKLFNTKHKLVSKAMAPVDALPKNSSPQAMQRFNQDPHDFYYILPDKIDKTELVRKYLPVIIEWLNTLKPTASMSLDLFQAFDKAVKWKEKQGFDAKIKKSQKIIKSYDNNYQWIFIKPGECSKEEGRLMNNCLRKPEEYSGVMGKNQGILSLRDEHNNPHVNAHIFNIKEGSIDFIEGKNGMFPKEKYLPYIIDLLNKEDYHIRDIFTNTILDMLNIYDYDYDKYGSQEAYKVQSDILTTYPNGYEWKYIRDGDGVTSALFYNEENPGSGYVIAIEIIDERTIWSVRIYHNGKDVKFKPNDKKQNEKKYSHLFPYLKDMIYYLMTEWRYDINFEYLYTDDNNDYGSIEREFLSKIGIDQKEVDADNKRNWL